MKEKKITPLSRISGKKSDGLDTVKLAKSMGSRVEMRLLMDAERHWSAMAKFREDRERNKKYTYGDQWSDKIEVDGKTMKESEYIASQGSIPLKNNLVRRLVRNVLGVYLSQSKEPTCTARDRNEQRLGEVMSTVLQYNWQMNRMSEINARTVEDFLIGGMIVHKKTFSYRNDKMECWTDYVNPNNFIIDNSMKDFRGWDVSFIGEIHDISFPAICRGFAKSPEDVERLKQIYQLSMDDYYVKSNCENFGYSNLRNLNFFTPSDRSLCRVIEIWKKEMKPRYRCHDVQNGDYYKIEVDDYADMVERENQDRIDLGLSQGLSREDIPLIKATWFMDDYWYYRFLSPLGHVLEEGETPYRHKSHPYVFKMYPFIDGEIHSFVSDVIDQQRYVNRLITMYDWIMRSSAKGVLLFPEECLPDNMSLDDIADEWSRYDGVIAIKVKPGVPLPQQISNNATNIGIGELLNLQLKFFEDISGIHGAIQGKPGYSGMSGSLYSQQAQNATTSLLDLLEAFSGFVIDSAYKDVKNIQQFYDSKRVFNISGSSKGVEYDPEKIQDVEFDLSIIESTSTPAYRQVANEFLIQIWQSGQINLEQLLEHGDFSFSDELLQSIKAQKEQMASGEGMEEMPMQIKQQAERLSNPSVIDKLYNMLSGRNAA